MKKHYIKNFLIVFAVLISVTVLTPSLIYAAHDGTSHAGSTNPEASLGTPASSESWLEWGLNIAGVGTGAIGKGVSVIFDAALSTIVTMVGGSLLFLAGFFFDWTATFSLLGTIYQSGQGSVVYEGWTIFRDLANILFIFILIYIGIATILRLGSAQTYQLLARVIVIALLINFSLVITRVVIDASNILALTFYDAFPPRNLVTDFASGVFSGLGDTKSLSAPFIESSGLLRLWDSSLFSGWLTARTPVLGIASGSAEVFVYNISELVVLLIASFVLFAAGILFAIRTVILMMLMILSPAAFAMYILPGTEGYARQWWSTLLKQAFFAPIFLALYYVAARIFGALFQSITITQGATDFYGSIGSIIINFSIVVIFLISTLIISQKLGAYGAGTLMSKGKKWGKKTTGFAGRHTIGRAAYALRESEGFRKFAERNPRAASIALQPISYTAKAPFGGAKGGFERSVKNTAERGARVLELLETTSPQGKKVPPLAAMQELGTKQNLAKRIFVSSARTDRETLKAYSKKKGKSSLERAVEEAVKDEAKKRVDETDGDDGTP